MNDLAFQNRLRKLFRNEHSRIPNLVVNVYGLVFISILSFLLGAYMFNHIISSTLALVAIIATFPLLFAVIFSESPLMMVIFAFVMGFAYHPVFAQIEMIDDTIILEALCITIILFFGLTLFTLSCQDLRSFQFFGFLHSILSTLIVIGIVNIFYHNSFIELAIIYVSIVVFSCFVVYDTANLFYSHESPVHHALHLFLDFINLFIYIIRLLIKEKFKGKK